MNQVFFRRSAMVSRSETATLTSFAGFEMRSRLLVLFIGEVVVARHPIDQKVKFHV